LNPRPLGYEPYDSRLCRPGLSLAIALTSAYGRRVSSPMPRGLPRLKPSRRVSCTNPCTNPVLDLRVSGRLMCATAHMSPDWSSRHRRPTRRGAGQASRVQVERPTGRTTWTRGAWSARLVLGRWWGDDQPSASATPQPRPCGGVHPGAPRSPPEAPGKSYVRFGGRPTWLPHYLACTRRDIRSRRKRTLIKEANGVTILELSAGLRGGCRPHAAGERIEQRGDSTTSLKVRSGSDLRTYR